ncbi:peptidase inhibitor 16-like [Gastrophryne carolinensis]
MSDVTPLCLLLLLLLFDLPPRPAALTANQKRRIVEKHNDYRSKPQPLAADMKALTWDKTLEQLATSYAAKCIWDHNEERGFRGENLFIMSGSNLDVDMGLDDWHRERDFYNFTANTCAEGQMCGHYTQMVWAGTERVGCGEKFCETLDGFEFGNMTLLVCNYEPPGNFEGEQPFSVGEPCSACPPTHRCQDTLCVDLEQKESSTEAPDTASAQTPDAASEPAPDATAVIDLATTRRINCTIYVNRSTRRINCTIYVNRSTRRINCTIYVNRSTRRINCTIYVNRSTRRINDDDTCARNNSIRAGVGCDPDQHREFSCRFPANTGGFQSQDSSRNT